MRLKELREAKDLTQKQAAKDLSIQQQTYQRYERGRREPRIDMLIKLADYFDVSVDYLIGHEKTSNQGNGQTLVNKCNCDYPSNLTRRTIYDKEI